MSIVSSITKHSLKSLSEESDLRQWQVDAAGQMSLVGRNRAEKTSRIALLTSKENVHAYGPFIGPRTALAYFQRWSEGHLAAALRSTEESASKESGSEAEHIVLLPAGGVQRRVECPGQATPHHATLELLDEEEGIRKTRHHLLRAPTGFLHYAAVSMSDEGAATVFVADPPICVSDYNSKVILSELGENVHDVEARAPVEARDDTMELLSNDDQIVVDCKHLLHRTVRENCGKNVSIDVLTATTQIIDGFAVYMNISVQKDGNKFYHSPECDFEFKEPDSTTEREKDLLPEEERRMATTIRMSTDLCTIDEMNGVSENAVADFGLVEQFALGDLSFYKGYEHVNDGLETRQLSGMRAPAELDLRKAYPDCFPGKNHRDVVRAQGSCGSCWSFATATAAMTTLCIDGVKKKVQDEVRDATSLKRFEISVQQIMSCNSGDYGCKGGAASIGGTALKNHGITREAHNTYKCSGGSSLNHFTQGNSCKDPPWGGQCKKNSKNPMWSFHKATRISKYDGEKGMIDAVVNGEGSYISFLVYSDFMSYQGGVYDDAFGHQSGGHAAVLIGYGLYGTAKNKKYWLLQNSWGKSWGENGFFRMLRGANFCNCESRNMVSFSAYVDAMAAPSTGSVQQPISNQPPTTPTPTANTDPGQVNQSAEEPIDNQNSARRCRNQLVNWPSVLLFINAIVALWPLCLYD